jgi:outer membrane protein assembly factor BamB
VQGPNRERGLPTPVQVAKIWMGGGISTPVFVGDALVAAGYDQRVHLYRLRYEPAQEGEEGALPSASGDGSFWTVSVTERAQHYAEAAFESTPVVWSGRVYIGCRDGWFYCLGDTP